MAVSQVEKRMGRKWELTVSRMEKKTEKGTGIDSKPF